MEIKSGIIWVAMVLVATVVFAALYPSVDSAITGSGATGTEATLLGNVGTFLAIGMGLAILLGSLFWLSGKGGD